MVDLKASKPILQAQGMYFSWNSTSAAGFQEAQVKLPGNRPPKLYKKFPEVPIEFHTGYGVCFGVCLCLQYFVAEDCCVEWSDSQQVVVMHHLLLLFEQRKDF